MFYRYDAQHEYHILYSKVNKNMITTQNKIIFASVLAVSLTVLSVMVQPQIFAEKTEEKQYTKTNNIAIHTVFTFFDAVEKSDSLRFLVKRVDLIVFQKHFLSN